MTSKHNPKDTALTAPEFIHCLLEPSAIFPCGGEEPDFRWFDDPQSHLNAVHFKLKEQLFELREWYAWHEIENSYNGYNGSFRADV